MFQFPACARLNVVHSLQLCGFPHSDIAGSIPVCRSPALFAAYHVLLRFWKPRHPPFALLLFLVLLSESTLRLSSVSSFFTRFAYEIAVLFATRKNSNLLIRLNLFFFFTSLSLSVLSMIFGFPLPVRKGLQRYKLFLNLQIFLYNFLKNSSFSRTPIYNKVSTYDLYSIY